MLIFPQYRLADASLFYFMLDRQSRPTKQLKTKTGMALPLHTADVCLLSLERCRALLPADCELSDAELERLRDGMYALAGAAVDGFFAQRPKVAIIKFPNGKGEK